LLLAVWLLRLDSRCLEHEVDAICKPDPGWDQSARRPERSYPVSAIR